uniref:Uncharacterized protein n=1 Tax=Romanomermis culicivorax TaxID=13658 RepID=A0A915KCT5_ROMCU
MGSTTGDSVAAVGDVSWAGAGDMSWAAASDVSWAAAGGVGSVAGSFVRGEEAMVTVSVGGVAATGGAAVHGAAATAGRRIGLACLTARRMASTVGEDGSPTNKNFSTGKIVIVPLAMNSSAHPGMSGHKSRIDTGATSTTSAAVSASTCDRSLSKQKTARFNPIMPIQKGNAQQLSSMPSHKIW